ncbi:coiled-coil domain-containing protein 93 [Drosophila sulfurigaster albostrigata]|uniref:coiled-coil domain-containing protein 93 n=1 Tax=Drosophila sulfurigaster albostrigata TaxID=89887 RepID=UPI002D21C465|nr:coiled-coil domain-containing protein 93 [Drosophila sulfurigaster albostrigata]
MANRDVFSKILPNVKLATRLDADGREIQVERREDTDAAAKELDTFDMLVAAGYYRARIKGLSAFDKVVGGMTWCIECCDYDVDVDLLFHENLTIGQKIALVEKIVAVLIDMKCPHDLEPHQVQGLEFLAIHPVIQWLVKTSVANREERGQRLKRFAIGQFHNDYQYKSDKDNLTKIRLAAVNIKAIQELYSPKRLYERKEATSEDDALRVRLTLMEYGDLGLVAKPSDDAKQTANLDPMELKLEQQLRQLSVANGSVSVAQKRIDLDPNARSALQQHYAEFKLEMETDAQELKSQNQQKRLEAAKIALEHKIKRYNKENEQLESTVETQKQETAQEVEKLEKLKAELEAYKQTEANADSALLDKVRGLLQQHDELKKSEAEFKESCRTDLANLQQQIDELESFNAQDVEAQAAAIAKEQQRLQELRLHLAKRNRGIVAIERKLDAIPDRTELAQYQRRFHELHNEMSAKHLETKQYYTLYNTLNDKKRYLEKELSLLNSICEAYNEGMLSPHGREDFIRQFETIVDGVKSAQDKVRHKYNEERMRRDELNEELLGLLELQRQYAAAIKQLTRECQRCEQLQQHLKSIQKQTQ